MYIIVFSRIHFLGEDANKQSMQSHHAKAQVGIKEQPGHALYHREHVPPCENYQISLISCGVSSDVPGVSQYWMLAGFAFPFG